MRIRVWLLLALLTAIVFGSAVASGGRAMGQESDELDVESSATPEALGVPEFYITAVHDEGTGYFADVEIQPGTSQSLTIAIINSGDVPAELRTYKTNALSGINGGFVSGELGDPPISSNEWIEYPTVELALESGEQREIQFSVSVPIDVEPGQYITGLIVETSEPLAVPGTDSLDQVIRFAITVGILVPGEITHSFELDAPKVLDEGVHRFLEIPVRNTGNYLVRPTGEVTLTDSDGQPVLTSAVGMGSVYNGLSTTARVALPVQMPPGEYVIDLTLTDPESGATDSIEGVTVTVPEPVDPTGVSVTSTSIEPNAEEIVFANVDVTLNNGGQQIPASDVTLEVLRDGEQVDSFPLATNQVLLNGENTYTTRYIPADMWEPGTYTFRIVVSAVDPNGGQETILLTEDLDAEIVVP